MRLHDSPLSMFSEAKPTKIFKDTSIVGKFPRSGDESTAVFSGSENSAFCSNPAVSGYSV